MERKWLWVLCIAIVAGALYVGKPWLIVLLCPLMHLIMMAQGEKCH
ncbi:DUF2933 domain-containing protein [Candidatus Woesearchaeota archaeon]|nr:DUF2933 domain-containing protein [Candidatus Woesearchaeota archaeon]